MLSRSAIPHKFKRLYLFFTLLSFSTVAQTQTESQIAEARRRVTEPPKVTRLPDRTVRVPLVGTKTLPLIEAKINGRGPYRLLVDSAANVTLLQMRVADELKLPVLRPGESSKLVAVKKIEIGGATFEDVVVGAREWNEKIDGILGFGLFAECLLTFDYPRQTLLMGKGSLQKANGRDIITYGLDARSPTLEIEVGGQKLTVLLDTGAMQGLVVPPSFSSKLRFVRPPTTGPQLSTFETARSQALIGQLDGKITFGSIAVSRPTIHIWDDVPVLGSDFFKGMVITFDQKNRRVRFR